MRFLKNAFTKRYQDETDENGIRWRIERTPGREERVSDDVVLVHPDEIKVVKLFDPNFVHAKEPLPTVKVFGKDIEPLSVGIVAVAAVEMFLLGTLVA